MNANASSIPVRCVRPVQRPLQFAVACTVAMAMLAAGCDGTKPAATPAADAKIFKLISVNGATIPATIPHDGVSLQVHSGTFTLGADGTCGTSTVFSPPSGKPLTRDVTATYTQSGPTLTMHWRGAGTTTGTLEGATFTLNNEGMVLVYHR